MRKENLNNITKKKNLSLNAVFITNKNNITSLNSITENC